MRGSLVLTCTSKYSFNSNFFHCVLTSSKLKRFSLFFFLLFFPFFFAFTKDEKGEVDLPTCIGNFTGRFCT